MRDTPHPNAPDDYNRPQQPWACGNSVDGEACPFSPLKGGRCPNLAECQPVQDQQGEWICNRAESRGGSCDNGPSVDGRCGCVHSCTPVPSLRTTRGRWMRVTLLFVVGMSLLLLGSAWRQAVIVPGELTSHHAQVLRGDRWQSRCSACHAAGERSSADWLAAAAAGHQIGPAQSDRCMACHDETIPVEFALSPHGLDPALLNEIANYDGQPPSGGRSELGCSVCHQEHHGADFNLSLIDDARCQACHRQQYDHFASDHPDFGRWPYERRTRIAFDHAGHANKHYTTQNQKFDCRDCHQLDATGSAHRTLPFEQACAKCHVERLELAAQGGFELLTLPIIDTDALADAGHDVAWPDGATGDFDGQLPPALILLLAGDPAAREAMSRFGKRVDLFDADPDSAADMAAVATLARSIIKLTEELAGDPNQAVVTRLARLGSEATVSEAVALHVPAMASSTAGWFTGDIESNAADARWSRNDTLFQLAFHPTGHSDPLIKAWLDFVVSIPDAELRDNALQAIGGAKSVGTCITCHTIEPQADGELAINWGYDQTTPVDRGFTRFSHAPHTLQPELYDCSHCHTLREQVSGPVDLLQYDPQVFSSDFAPLVKSSCTSCHQPNAATSRCTTCHGYHIGEVRGRTFEVQESAERR